MNDEVCGLGALDRSVPTGPTPEPPPLPPPELLDIVTEDQNMETGESEDEWKLVRRIGGWARRNILGVIQCYTKQQKERRLSVSIHIIVEESAPEQFSGEKERAVLLGNREQAVEYVARGALGSRPTLCGEYTAFLAKVPTHSVPAVVQIPYVSCGSSASGLLGGNQAKKANCLKVAVFGHTGPRSAKTDSFSSRALVG